MADSYALPRLVIAGLSGDSGKTLVTLGLLLAASERGIQVQAFKKGPDYIDAAWLTWASGRPARNLDTFLMGFERCASAFASHGVADGLNLIEGNRGLFDGADAAGTHSTAELAKILRAPVVLVFNVTKTTRTAAAFVLGCQKLDPEVRIAGVILNQVAGLRHEKVIREAIESACGIPILGTLPRAAGGILLPERHLGLVTPDEHPRIGELKANVLALTRGRLELGKLLGLARDTPAFAAPPMESAGRSGGEGLRIGYLRDSAFNFYYPENIEALERAHASIIPLSPLKSDSVPDDLSALYIGGGFPETHGAEISSNSAFLASLRKQAESGLPVYAECGGLMLLSRAIIWHGRRFPMAGVLPFEVEVFSAPQGHGYVEMTVDRPNPYFPEGLLIRGHEFHYSAIVPRGEAPSTACRVARGTGSWKGRDGVTHGNVWASYTHIHAAGTPEWSAGLLGAARRRREKTEPQTF